METSLGLSFVDDVTWVVRGDNVPQVTKRLEECARITTEWAGRNAVKFETDKTEAILFTKSKNQRLAERRTTVQVDSQGVRYAENEIRWLGVWLDYKLTLQEHHQKWLAKAKGQQARLQRICHTRGLPSPSVANLQRAVVQSIATYGIELLGIMGKQRIPAGRTQDIQKVINWQARHTTRCHRSTRVGILLAESQM